MSTDFNGKREDGVWNPFDDYSSICDVVQGVNWGTIFTHPLPPYIVVQLLRDNGIKKVKLFDANLDTMRALALSNLEVMVAIPNEMLEVLTLDSQAAND